LKHCSEISHVLYPRKEPDMNFTSVTRRVTALLVPAGRALALVGVVFAHGPQQEAFAQAQVSPRPSVTLYRGFYYDATDKLLHIEEVRNLGGRVIQPLLPSPVKAAPPMPPDTVEAALAGANSAYVVYYGLDASDAIPVAGSTSTLRPLAFERLAPSDGDRPIKCATPGGSTCFFPKFCHCAASTGGCCCY
jgi:hypothetical protein